MPIAIKAYFAAIRGSQNMEGAQVEANEALKEVELLQNSEYESARRVFQAIAKGDLDLESSQALAGTMQKFTENRILAHD